MEDKALIITDPAALNELAKTQQTQVAQLTKLCEMMAQLVYTMDARVSSMEKAMKTRVTVSYTQSKALLQAAQERSAALCSMHHLPEKEAGKALRAAIWRDFCREYGIRNRVDLPELYYEQALTYINGWTSFAAIRRIRDRLGL